MGGELNFPYPPIWFTQNKCPQTCLEPLSAAAVLAGLALPKITSTICCLFGLEGMIGLLYLNRLPKGTTSEHPPRSHTHQPPLLLSLPLHILEPTPFPAVPVRFALPHLRPLFCSDPSSVTLDYLSPPQADTNG